MTKAKDYNSIEWNDYFYLDKNSPSGLSWKIPRYYKGTPNYDRVGTFAGSISNTHSKSYWVVGLSVGNTKGTYLITGGII